MSSVKLIILEGPDKAGKSSVAKCLLEVLETLEPHNACVMKRRRRNLPSFGSSNKILYYDYLRTLKEAKMCTKKYVILDRFYPSQLIYSFLRGEDDLNDSKSPFWDIEKEVLKLPHLLVYIQESEKIILERYAKNPDDYLPKEKIRIIQKRYEEFLKTTKLKYIVLEKGTSVEERTADILREILPKSDSQTG